MDPPEDQENKARMASLFKNAFSCPMTESQLDPCSGPSKNGALPQESIVVDCGGFTRKEDPNILHVPEQVSNQLQELSDLTCSKEREDQGVFQVFHLGHDQLSVEQEEPHANGSDEVHGAQKFSSSNEGSSAQPLASDGSAGSLIHLLSAKYEELQKEFHQLKSISYTHSEKMQYVTTRLMKLDGDSVIQPSQAQRAELPKTDRSVNAELHSELSAKDAEIAMLQRQLRMQALEYEGKISDLIQANNELQYEVQRLRGVNSLAGLSRQLANFELFGPETPRMTSEVAPEVKDAITNDVKKENELLWLLVNLCDKELKNSAAVTPTSPPNLIPTLSTILSLKSSQLRAR